MRCKTIVVSFLLPAVLCAGCASSRKLAVVKSGAYAAAIRLPEEKDTAFEDTLFSHVGRDADTLMVTGLDGKEVFIMRAVKDTASGEMVATEQLDAAMVTARFRNVAERNGFVDIRFQVTVPPEMTDSRWQLRLYPEMTIPPILMI